MTIQQAYKSFLRERAGYCSDKTIKAYSEHLSVYFDWLERVYKSVSVLDFEDIPPGDNIMTDYVLYLRNKRKVSNSTIRSYSRSIKAFLNYCYQEDYCRDFLKKVKLPSDDAVPPEPLLQDEVERLDNCFYLDTLQGLRNYCIVHLMLDCGLRTQEVIHLELHHIDPEHNLLHVINSKGNKSRITLIPDFLIDAIKSYMLQSGRSSGIVFQNLRKAQPLTEDGIKTLFQDLKSQADIPRLHAHLLRHTFATSYLCGGGNLEFLRVMMGHSDYTVTKIYSSLSAQYKMLGVQYYKLDAIFFRVLG